MSGSAPAEDKVAFITGIARGQGRAHAMRLASDGVRIIGLDMCRPIDSIDYPLATEADLHETVRLVEAAGGEIVVSVGDVRHYDDVERAVAGGLERFGRLDIVVANAGIIRISAADKDAELSVWKDIVDVNLTGVYNTVRATVDHVIAGGRGGSFIFVSSSAALRPTASSDVGMVAYATTKRALTGLMQVLAGDLARHSIRVNTIHPTGVATPMVVNDAMRTLAATAGSTVAGMRNAMPIELLEPEQIAEAVAWLASERADYITGVAMPLDAGFSIR